MFIQTSTSANNLVSNRPAGPQQPSNPSTEAVETAVDKLMRGEHEVGEQFADSYGRVKHLALMLSDGYVQGDMRPQVLNAYNTLFQKMEPDTKFTIVAATDKDEADIQHLVEENHVANPERIQIVKPGLEDLTVWARDMMVPKFIPGDPDHTVLVAQEPLHNWHLSDSKVPASICEANPSITLENEKAIVTDGGDTQSNTKESFVGAYSLSATENKLHEGLRNSAKLDEVIAWYEKRTGKEVVQTPYEQTFPFKFVGDVASDGTNITRMVVNHDYKKPELGANQVSDEKMYDDISVGLFEANFNKPVTIMGRDIPFTAHREEPATDHMDMGMTPIDDKTFMVGDPSLAHQILGTSPGRNRDRQEDFDAYAETLKIKGYNVVRMPHLEPAGPGEPYLTYNNCLMERFSREDGSEVRRVFLPVYGNEKLDQAATQIWQGQGFEVIPMQLDHLSSSWGALRCISNWLDRSPAA